MQIVVEVKKWGNSFGIVVPKTEVKALGLKAGEKIKLEILKKERIDAFGISKGAAPFEEEELIREEFDLKRKK